MQTLFEWFDTNLDNRAEFLRAHGYGEWKTELLTQDMAARRYWRLAHTDKTLILMESVPDHHRLSTQGCKQQDFLRIMPLMHDAGLKVPDIYLTDLNKGFIVLEDFGDITFGNALDSGYDANRLYSLAVDTLKIINGLNADCSVILPNYLESYVHKGRERLLEWYTPLACGKPVTDDMRESFHVAWTMSEKLAFDRAGQPDLSFLHIDYHVQNLMLLQQETGLRQCGILDFQTAMTGPRPYDLGNLLEDARRHVASDLREQLVMRYLSGMNKTDHDSFKIWYRFYAAEFHARVAGQFIKLVYNGKPWYAKFLPVVLDYLRRDLQTDILSPISEWCTKWNVSLEQVPEITLQARSLVARDAA